MWKIKYEWLKPGVREREIEAKVHEFMLERGCEIIYDIIVASGGNTSPYRRWATDKLIRQGDRLGGSLRFDDRASGWIHLNTYVQDRFPAL